MIERNGLKWLIGWFKVLLAGTWLYLLTSVVVASIYAWALIYVGIQVEGMELSQFKKIGISALFVVVLKFLSGIFNDWTFDRMHRNAMVWMSKQLQAKLPNLLSKWSKDQLTYGLTVNYPFFCEAAIYAFINFTTNILVSSAVAFYLFQTFSATLPKLLLFVSLGLSVSFILQLLLRRQAKSLDEIDAERFSSKQILIEGFENLKISNQLKSWTSKYIETTGKWLKVQKKMSVIQHASVTLNWGARYLFVILIISPLTVNSPISASDAYWLYIIMGLIIQFFWVTYQVGQTRIHINKTKEFVSEADFEDRRACSKDFSISLKEVQIFFGKEKTPWDSNPINCTLKKGDIFWISGPSGAGKTTLLKAILGLHENYSGQISVPNGNHSFSYLSQPPYVPTSLPLKDITGISSWNEEIKNLVNQLQLTSLFDSFGWDLERVAETTGFKFSAGQKTRLALLREILRKPEIVVLDEPSGNLDQSTAEAVFGVFKKIQPKTIIVLADHNEQLKNVLPPSAVLKLGPQD